MCISWQGKNSCLFGNQRTSDWVNDEGRRCKELDKTPCREKEGTHSHWWQTRLVFRKRSRTVIKDTFYFPKKGSCGNVPTGHKMVSKRPFLSSVCLYLPLLQNTNHFHCHSYLFLVGSSYATSPKPYSRETSFPLWYILLSKNRTLPFWTYNRFDSTSYTRETLYNGSKES